MPSAGVPADQPTGGSDVVGAGPGSTPTADPGAWSQRLRVLDELDARPLEEHAEIYRGLHADLQDALAEIDGA